MPKYLLHIATAPKKLRQSKLGFKGLIAPDVWQYSTPTEEEYMKFFEGIDGAPPYREIQALCSLRHGGTHFGSNPSDTTRADLAYYFNMLSQRVLTQKNIFYAGYLHHLIVDREFHIDTEIYNVKMKYKVPEESTIIDSHILQEDWYKVNHALAYWHPDIVPLIKELPEEAKSNCQMIDGSPTYVSIKGVYNFIQRMNKLKLVVDLMAIATNK